MDRPASAGADNEDDDDYELTKRNNNKSNNEDDEENSSTENYESLDFKSWRKEEEEEEEEEEDYNPARASLTVELGPATSNSARLAADTSALVAGIRTAK